MNIAEEIIQKIHNLPDKSIQEINDFLDFIIIKNDLEKSALCAQFQETREISRRSYPAPTLR